MRIQTPNTQLNIKRQSNTKETKSNVSFGGVFDTASWVLRFLDTNKAWGANFVDFGFMVTPRTAVDFTRGPDAGFETMRRESGGTTNHTLIGAYGLGAALLFSQALNKKYGVMANKIFASDDTIDILGKMWHDEIHKNKAQEPLHGFLTRLVAEVKGFNPTLPGAKNGLVNIPEDSRGKIVDALKDLIEKSGTQATKKEVKEYIKTTKAYIKTLMGSSIESENNFKISNNAKDQLHFKEVTLSLDTFIDNVYQLSKSFKSKNVDEAFRNSSKFNANIFIKELKGLNKKISILGIGTASVLGMTVQPLNRYLTKKKTGSDGFVGGDKDRKPDKTAKFTILKAATAGAFGAMVLSTLIKKPGEVIKNPGRILKIPSELIQKIQFKGFTPTIDQFKFVYGVTIISRFFAARDKDELREASIKDTLGFLNWIILGNFVTKLVGMGFEKYSKFDDGTDNTFLRHNISGKGFKSWFKKLTESDLVSRDEVLYSALKKEGKQVIKDGKALTFKEMLKLLPDSNRAKTKIKFLNIAQLAGYVYSGVVLGIGIPKLNIAITKSIGKKRAENKKDISKTPSNITFLNETQAVKSFSSFSGKK